MGVYELRIESGGDELKAAVANVLCPDENHPPPCPVPWSFGYAEGALLLAICAEPAAARDVAERVRVLTGLPVSLDEADPADHETLVEQYRIESGLRAQRC